MRVNSFHTWTDLLVNINLTEELCWKTFPYNALPPPTGYTGRYRPRLVIPAQKNFPDVANSTTAKPPFYFLLRFLQLLCCKYRQLKHTYHGHPKGTAAFFFRYISERYPLTSQIIEENKIPEFDNLYLDFNGIIHSCSHPNDNDAHFRLSEEQIFTSIFAYVDHLFGKIKPKKLFFMAVDGVAPRAKMNQQRSRRFRTAKEAREASLASSSSSSEVLQTQAK
ncbi:hypothetical protein BV25DRAFT_1911968 [Artomyces pyxidatus]|uniref:Uncharacterized protein n=1 Tax=Artomyces pyxidatus TaxID=48021 RepID=A0ACB8TFW8_9AGAM|nr:hypothetical protein BV25DRAFT_1911968 [Artomyces pyxidatus]